MTNEHTVHSFDEDLAAVERDVLRMGRHTQQQLAALLAVLETPEPIRAQGIIESDHRIDELCEQVEREVQAVIARRQPMAEDLRGLMSLYGCSTDLERIGDHLKSSARRLLVLWDAEPDFQAPELHAMAVEVQSMLGDVLLAWEHRDPELARQAWNRDGEVDRQYHRFVEAMMDIPDSEAGISPSQVRVAFIAKSLERIGDHATNIAEDLVHWLTGERMVRSTLGTPL